MTYHRTPTHLNFFLERAIKRAYQTCTTEHAADVLHYINNSLAPMPTPPVWMPPPLKSAASRLPRYNPARHKTPMTITQRKDWLHIVQCIPQPTSRAAALAAGSEYSHVIQHGLQLRLCTGELLCSHPAKVPHAYRAGLLALTLKFFADPYAK